MNFWFFNFFLDLWFFSSLFFFRFIGFFFKFLRLLLKVTEVITEPQKWHKICQNTIKGFWENGKMEENSRIQWWCIIFVIIEGPIICLKAYITTGSLNCHFYYTLLINTNIPTPKVLPPLQKILNLTLTITNTTWVPWERHLPFITLVCS